MLLTKQRTNFENRSYYANLGKSNQEIALWADLSHQSQGFWKYWGEDVISSQILNGDPLTNKENVFLKELIPAGIALREEKHQELEPLK
jgi:hypothetical protein